MPSAVHRTTPEWPPDVPRRCGMSAHPDTRIRMLSTSNGPVIQVDVAEHEQGGVPGPVEQAEPDHRGGGPRRRTRSCPGPGPGPRGRLRGSDAGEHAHRGARPPQSPPVAKGADETGSALPWFTSRPSAWSGSAESCAMPKTNPASSSKKPGRWTPRRVAWYVDIATFAHIEATCAATGQKRTQLISMLVGFGLKSPQFRAYLDKVLL